MRRVSHDIGRLVQHETLQRVSHDIGRLVFGKADTQPIDAVVVEMFEGDEEMFEGASAMEQS